MKESNFKKHTQIYQGDVCILFLGKNFKVNKTQEIKPENGKLVLVPGEETGHSHHINVLEHAGEPHGPQGGPLAFSANADAMTKQLSSLVKASKRVENIFSAAENIQNADVHLYVDNDAVQRLVNNRILTRTDLAVGFLVVEGGGDIGVGLAHEEHEAFRLTEGCYYIGRQIESAGAEERMVQD